MLLKHQGRVLVGATRCADTKACAAQKGSAAALFICFGLTHGDTINFKVFIN